MKRWRFSILCLMIMMIIMISMTVFAQAASQTEDTSQANWERFNGTNSFFSPHTHTYTDNDTIYDDSGIQNRADNLQYQIDRNKRKNPTKIGMEGNFFKNKVDGKVYKNMKVYTDYDTANKELSSGIRACFDLDVLFGSSKDQ